MVEFPSLRGSESPALLLDAARRLERFDATLARETYLEALRGAMFVGRLGPERGVVDAAQAARAAPPPQEPPSGMDLLLDGLATRFTKGYLAGFAPLERALDAFPAGDGSGANEMQWLWLACPVVPEPLAPDLWDDEAWHVLTARAVELARRSGALTVLPTALTYRAIVDMHAGDFDVASALIEEADAITDATGVPPLNYTNLPLAAWRGREVHARELIEARVRDALARGEGRALGLVEYASAVLHNGLGRYQAALAAAHRGCEYEDLGFFGSTLIELVEAAVRTGAREDAEAAFRQLDERTRAADTDWGLGIRARSLALLSDGDDAEALYVEAIDRLARSRITAHLARARLLYGEWLRREHRRVDAREQLRAAHEMFTAMGAEAFAERARGELLAAGETVRRRTVETRDELTAQEAQVARLARDGHTNPEIGAQLFISPRTVEWHLRNVFTKLGIRSRRELHDALPDAAPARVTA